MRPLLGGMAVALATAIVLCGCSPEKDEVQEATPPKVVVFQGAVDSKFVGTWETSDQRSRLVLAKDGGLEIGATIAGPGGDSKSNIKGQWLIDKDSLLLKYQTPNQGDTVIKYQATLSGKNLTCKQPGGRLTTTYVKQ